MRYVLAILLLVSATPAMAQRWHHHNGGGGIIGGVVGGVIGGVIGSQIDRPPPPPAYYPPEQGYDPVAWCASRFRSYNPATGFYRGLDGYLHRCP